MNIVVCDYCKERSGELVEAVDVIPTFVLVRSRQKVGDLGICEEHKRQLIPTGAVASRERVGKAAEKAAGQAVAAAAPKKIGARKRKTAALPDMDADGAEILTARQIAERIGRPLKSMGYVLGKVKPVGKEGKQGKAFVYRRDDLIRRGIISDHAPSNL